MLVDDSWPRITVIPTTADKQTSYISDIHAQASSPADYNYTGRVARVNRPSLSRSFHLEILFSRVHQSPACSLCTIIFSCSRFVRFHSTNRRKRDTGREGAKVLRMKTRLTAISMNRPGLNGVHSLCTVIRVVS